MATNKSKSNYWLTYHVATYTSVMAIFIAPFWYSLGGSFYFFFLAVTFATHWITDWSTSRWTSILYLAGKRHWFFVVIGLDQLIHAVTLYATVVSALRFSGTLP